MSSTDPIGSIVAGRYRIISRLGAGGMGVAYRAWDERGGVPVVIKSPKQAFLEDPAFAERFYREIRLLQGLDHPHIVPIVDVGEHDGLPFVVLRFLPGGSLSNRRLRDEKGKPKQNPAGMLHLWLPAVAEALDHVHAHGVVHRDVKPANVFFDAFWGPISATSASPRSSRSPTRSTGSRRSPRPTWGSARPSTCHRSSSRPRR